MTSRALHVYRVDVFQRLGRKWQFWFADRVEARTVPEARAMFLARWGPVEYDRRVFKVTVHRGPVAPKGVV